MARRGVWQLQKLIVSYSDWGGSSRGIRFLANSLLNPNLCKLKSLPRSDLLCSQINPSFLYSNSSSNDDEEWNDAWESAWIPENQPGKIKTTWDTDVDFRPPDSNTLLSPEVDPETKAFVEDINDNWNERRQQQKNKKEQPNQSPLYNIDNIKRDYRLRKQRIHASLWMKEIQKQREEDLNDPTTVRGGDDIDRLLDSCSEIFDSPNNDEFINCKTARVSEVKNQPGGWEATTKVQDGNVWEMSQKEEDILLQEFDRRIAFCKFKIASFIKTHIFSRRRPIDGWKYMIEELGPNAKRGKGSLPRLPALSDSSTQPFKEDIIPTTTTSTLYSPSFRPRRS